MYFYKMYCRGDLWSPVRLDGVLRATTGRPYDVNREIILFLPREDVIKLEVVANLAHFLLNGIIDGNAAVLT